MAPFDKMQLNWEIILQNRYRVYIHVSCKAQFWLKVDLTQSLNLINSADATDFQTLNTFIFLLFSSAQLRSSFPQERIPISLNSIFQLHWHTKYLYICGVIKVNSFFIIPCASVHELLSKISFYAVEISSTSCFRFCFIFFKIEEDCE